MELALGIHDVTQLDLLEDMYDPNFLSPMEKETIDLLNEAVDCAYGPIETSRMYFGSEFCQYRIAPLEDVKRAYEAAREKGLRFTYVTPYVPEDGMNKLFPILHWLNERETPCEVVVNDWGIGYAISTRYPNVKIVLGRLLNKMIRDPRVAHLYNEKSAPELAKSVFMNTSLETPYFKRFLSKLGVDRVEYDSFIQPVEKSTEREGLNASLYLGYGVVATGRSCLVGTLHKPREEKFQGDVQCKQQCTLYVAQMENTRPTLGQLPVRTLQKGNTAFYQQTETLMSEGLEWAKEMGINRLIVSPKIPV